MPQHHITLLLKLSTYFGALFVIIGITGATLVHYVPSIMPVYSVVLAFIASVVLVGAITWAITKSEEYGSPNYAPDA
jgi:hypothetical protein